MNLSAPIVAFAFKLLAWSSCRVLRISTKIWQLAGQAVAATDAANADRPKRGLAVFSADEALAQSIVNFYLLAGPDFPEILVKRLIQANHVYQRLQALWK